MSFKPSIIERAYQLAERFRTLLDIRKQLVSEGYDDVDTQLAAPELRRRLNRLCRASSRTALDAAHKEGAREGEGKG